MSLALTPVLETRSSKVDPLLEGLLRLERLHLDCLLRLECLLLEAILLEGFLLEALLLESSSLFPFPLSVGKENNRADYDKILSILHHSELLGVLNSPRFIFRIDVDNLFPQVPG